VLQVRKQSARASGAGKNTLSEGFGSSVTTRGLEVSALAESECCCCSCGSDVRGSETSRAKSP
jgi:hypothetical protein